MTLINDNFIDHDEHLQQFSIMNKFRYADILTKNMKIDSDKFVKLAEVADNLSEDADEKGNSSQNLELDLNGNPIEDIEYDSNGNTIE